MIKIHHGDKKYHIFLLLFTERALSSMGRDTLWDFDQI